MQKVVLTLIVVLVVAGFVFARPQPSSPTSIKPTPLQTDTIFEKSNPYLIQNTAVRNWDSTILSQTKTRETSRFISYEITYKSDNLLQYALMNVPKGTMPQSGWPAIFVNHGHIDPQIYSTANSYINTSAYYANAGFLVLKPDYRGHGRSEGEADGVLSRINYAADVLNLIAAVKKLDTADGDHIYMYGHSMGGDVSLRVMEICPACIRAVSLWAPAVTSFPESFLYFARKTATTDPKRLETFQKRQAELAANFTSDQYTDVSTFDNVDRIRVPVIIHHATADQSVPYAWGRELFEKLQSLNKDVRFYTYQGDNHDIAGNWSTALNRDLEFFNSKLTSR